MGAIAVGPRTPGPRSSAPVRRSAKRSTSLRCLATSSGSHTVQPRVGTGIRRLHNHDPLQPGISAAKKRAREAHYIKGTAQINSKDSKAGGGSCFGDSGD
jgi:hypothetical protein